VIPTNDELALVFYGTTPERFRERIAPSVADGFARELHRAAPELAARVLGSEAAAPYRTFPGLPGFLRRPAGPGWALVGDASYFKDPITAHGI
jgi:flavin-dependent dehydrogenase